MTALSGRLVVLEGLYASGKSTQVARLVQQLKLTCKQDVVVTEWNSSELLAHFILDLRLRGELSPRLLFLLELADFTARYERVIAPALARGAIVVSDRYIETGIVRGVVRGLPVDYCRPPYDIAVVPDVTIYLRSAPACALARRRGTGRTMAGYVSGQDFLTGYQTIEDCFVAYQSKMQDLYLRHLGDACTVVDADQSVNAVADDIFAIVEPIVSGGTFEGLQ